MISRLEIRGAYGIIYEYSLKVIHKKLKPLEIRCSNTQQKDRGDPVVFLYLIQSRLLKSPPFEIPSVCNFI